MLEPTWKYWRLHLRLTQDEQASAQGPLVRAARKAQGIRQDDAAGAIGVSENFLGKLENGEETVQRGKLFQVLQGRDIHLEIDVPDEVCRTFESEMARRKKQGFQYRGIGSA